MIGQGCAHARARFGDVIEPATLRRNKPIVNFSTVQSFAKINYHNYYIQPRVLYS